MGAPAPRTRGRGLTLGGRLTSARRLAGIGFRAGADLGLVLAGGYAISAHGLVDRKSQDIDFATSTSRPMTEVVSSLADAYRNGGFTVQVIECATRMARLLVSDASSECEVDILKEAIGPPALLSVGPVLALDDAIGLKMRALHERAAHRDFIDVHSANAIVSLREMEHLGARHTPGFNLDGLADRLGAIDVLNERTFADYGLDDDAIAQLREWAIGWESDIRRRLAAGEAGPSAPAGDAWDAYLDRT